MSHNETLKYEACKIKNFAARKISDFSTACKHCVFAASNSQNLTVFGVCKTESIATVKKSSIFLHAGGNYVSSAPKTKFSRAPNTIKILKKSKIFWELEKAKAFSKIRRILITPKSKILRACRTTFCGPETKVSRVSCSRVRREILELLYKKGRRCSGSVKEEFLIEKLEAKIDDNELKIHVDYLCEKGYVIIKSVYDGFVTVRKITITEKGIDLVGDPRL